MKTFEEPGIYKIVADPEVNRITMTFFGKMKKAADIPNYIEHCKGAVEVIKPGYQHLVFITKTSGAPGLQITGPLKESQKIFDGAGMKKSAVVLAPELMLQKMTLRVVTKLAGLRDKLDIFDNEEKALTWLEED